MSDMTNLDLADAELSSILWDIDGTLIDTTALIVGAMDQTFREFTGRSLPLASLRALIGIPIDQQMLAIGDPSQYGTDIQTMGEALIRHYEDRRDQEHPIPEAIDALIYCKRQGYRTALVTSKSDEELANTLPRLGISAYCDSIVSADRVAPNYKPHPRPVRLALEELGVQDPRTAVFVGDSVYDIQSGKSAGTRTAAVLWGAATETALRAESPDYVISRPEDLVKILLGVRAAA